MVSHEPRIWEFEVTCRQAVCVYLVMQRDRGASETASMEPIGSDTWQLRRLLPPGAYDFRYFVSDGQSITHFGSSGVKVRRMAATNQT
ncbi:MAG: hypothetical protein JJU36_10590 [Phycisphaeraceae bacterium]|nr:hypothetical protein [Phycisphaeraceae bacterium]